MAEKDNTSAPVDPWAAIEAEYLGLTGGTEEEAVDDATDGSAEGVESEGGENLAEGETSSPDDDEEDEDKEVPPEQKKSRRARQRARLREAEEGLKEREAVVAELLDHNAFQGAQMEADRAYIHALEQKLEELGFSYSDDQKDLIKRRLQDRVGEAYSKSKKELEEKRAETQTQRELQALRSSLEDLADKFGINDAESPDGKVIPAWRIIAQRAYDSQQTPEAVAEALSKAGRKTHQVVDRAAAQLQKNNQAPSVLTPEGGRGGAPIETDVWALAEKELRAFNGN